MSIEITPAMVSTALVATECDPAECEQCVRQALAAVLNLPEVRDAIYAEGVNAERERVRHLLSQPLLAGLRSIPDGRTQNGCVIHDGEQVREKLRAAYRAVVDGEEGI